MSVHYSIFSPEHVKETGKTSVLQPSQPLRKRPTVYFGLKRVMDLSVAVPLVLLTVLVIPVLLVANRFGNRGPLFFFQERMGKDCTPFTAIKFRTMRPIEHILRGADQPLELDRITPLGRIMRQLRLDELPQSFNVVRGEMSIVGPRPDYVEHAKEYLQSVPKYRDRYVVRPGITGLAQTEVGYVSSALETRRKVAADLIYIKRKSLRLEAWIFWRTVCVVFGKQGT